MEFAISLLLFFGIKLSIDFSGVKKSKKSSSAAAFLFLILLLAQLLSRGIVGFAMTVKIYPFIVHLPIVLFLVFYYKRNLSTAFISVCCAYLCCQIPRWFSMLAAELYGNRTLELAVYIICILTTLYLLTRYAVVPTVQVLKQGKTARLLFGVVPCFYYLFDYATTVYTNLLHTGSTLAVQFLPTAVSLLYFLFIIGYYAEQQRSHSMEQKALLMRQQFKEAENQISLLRISQEQTAIYCHDMRHHIALLSGFAENGDLPKIKEYLAQAGTDIDAVAPIRYCENEPANLILASFEKRAQKDGVAFCAKVALPQTLGISDNELFSLFSNALENAITAAAQMPEKSLRKVYVCALVNHNKLVVSIENAYIGKLVMEGELPKSQNNQPEHGFGMKSMVAIVERHGGLYSIETADGVFVLQMMLPLPSNAVASVN